MWRELHFTPWENCPGSWRDLLLLFIGRKTSVWAHTLPGKYKLLHLFLFPPLSFCFVMIISVPSYKSWATSKAGLITMKCCWQRAFWLLRHAGKACMTSHWTFLEAASHSSVGCCTWVAWQPPGLAPFQRGFDRYKSFLFSRKTFYKNIYTTKQKLF